MERPKLTIPLARDATARFGMLLVAAVLVPLFTFLAVAWVDRVEVLRNARQQAEDVADIAREQALGVFQTQELVAANVDQHIRGMSWDEIANSASLHAYLQRLDVAYPQINGVWIADASGVLRSSSLRFPLPQVNIADRDYFRALRARDDGMFIGQMVRNAVVSVLNFNVARRRETADGHFDGVVIVSALQSYLANFWRRISPQRDSITAIVRGDGMVLARQPELRPEAGGPPGVAQALPSNSVVHRLVTSGQARGSFRGISPIDGVERFYAVRRIGDYNVYVVHGIGVSATLARWHADLRMFGGFFAVGGAALTFLAALALQQARRERIATDRWRAAAQLANDEMQQRAAVEERLRHGQKMEALGQMAGSIAHDFNNILFVIGSSLEFLQGQQNDPRLERKVNVASDAVDRGARAIRSLLAFARRQPLHPKACNPATVLHGIQALLLQGLGRQSRLVLDLAADTWDVMIDVSQFEMAMLNLTVNARDAMPKGGTLRIAASNERLGGDPDGLAGEFVRLAVSDTGTGMAPEIAARAFEPFFTSKPVGKGTGLGLSQVYGFARQSGGTATLESAVGTGTTITLFLPRARPDSAVDGSAARVPTGAESPGMLSKPKLTEDADR